jgi:hypothetical protein
MGRRFHEAPEINIVFFVVSQFCRVAANLLDAVDMIAATKFMMPSGCVLRLPLWDYDFNIGIDVCARLPLRSY